ncbi:MAG: PEP-CTERM sorting domain-containing protein [Marinobacter sp.]|uniref:PEP-CTERM sorting domain-containing protein n=1 Tax=Marinobacter sp. TaxID=50741 RepID=UPI002B26498D|nr:PEP-CTERM sorting domain-containing protein [Marinobacter sp.]
MKSNKLLKAALLISGSLIWSSQASAVPMTAVTISGGSVQNTSIDTVIGWEFTALQDITVTSLGLWDEGADGFNNRGNEVGLWATDGTLLSSTAVSSVDSLANGFRFADVFDFTLTGGMNYIVGALLQAPDQYRYSATITDSAGVAWVDSRAVNSNSLTFPTGFTGSQGSWFGANFQYKTAQVPEPSTIALFGLGLLGMGFMRRRQIR